MTESVTPAEELVRAEIGRRGPIRFDEVMAIALYDPTAGFYATGGRAGRRGDFITSPEVGPLFGAVVARALDRWWRAAGEPAVFVVVEAGAGPGTLARAVLDAAPACTPALRYVLVERSDAQRELHAARLPLEDPRAASAALPDPDAEPAAVEPPPGPIVVSIPELPRLPGPCVVVANELLDNLPVRLAARGDGGWSEVLVGLDRGRLVEVLVPLDDATAARLDALVPAAAPGCRVPVADVAATWVREALELSGSGGRLVVFDYGTTTAELAQRSSATWLRTYRAHGRGTGPLEDLGLQDITCEVPVDQLQPAPSSDRTQAEWLTEHGIEELAAEGRRIWHERAAIGDLVALRARSRVNEAAALTDPAGLGAFRVLEWHRR